VKKAIVLLFLLMFLFLSGCTANSRSDNNTPKGPEQKVATEPTSPATRGSPKIADDLPPKTFITDFAYSYRPNGELGKPSSLQNGDTLHTGDHYKIQFTPKEECYVYIFQNDSSHQLFSLFPTKNFIGADEGNDNPVRAKTYFVPGEGKSFVLNDQVGTEEIHFLVFRKPNLELEQQYKDLLHARQQGDTNKTNMAQAKVKKFTKGPLPQVAYDEDSTVIVDQEGMFKYVQGRRLVCEGDNCVSSITFKHLP